VSSQPPDSVSPTEAAALVLAGLEARGACFRITSEGDLDANLDGVRPALTQDKARMFATVILGLRDEIKAELRRRAVHH
jgi:hypothetical protein